MPAIDLASRVKRLARNRHSELADLLTDGEAEWGPHEENTAELLEVQSYLLELAWVDRTTNPDDPEVKAERRKAEASGIKPPKRPLVPPIAHRPKKLAEQRFEDYLSKLAEANTPERIREQLDSDEFDRRLRLT